MWHEARKQEKKIRGMIVDYRKRADRRKEFYEKIKQDPIQFLSIYGRKSKIHYDVSEETHMMKWQGQDENLIDRFDVRAHLDFIPPAKQTLKDEANEQDVQMERLLNYERYRILAQNDFLGITEENFLKQVQLEEQFGVIANPQTDTSGKKKNSQANAAIGYTYEDSTSLAIPFSKTIQNIESTSSNRYDEFAKDYSDESDMDVDVSIDINKIGTQEAHELNNCGKKFGMMTNDFFSYLTKDEDEKQSMRALKEQEADKIAGGGRKSRRERRSQRERRVIRPLSPPSYAAKEEKKENFDDDDDDEKSSRENSKSPLPEKITYITSFGGEEREELKPHAKISIKIKPSVKLPEPSKSFTTSYADQVRQNLVKLKKINKNEKARRSRSVSTDRRRDSRSRSQKCRRESSRSTSNSRRYRYSSSSATSGSKRYRFRSRSYSSRRTRSSRSYSKSSYSSYSSRTPDRKLPYSRKRSYSSRDNSTSRRESSRSLSRKRFSSSSSSSTRRSTSFSSRYASSPEKRSRKRTSRSSDKKLRSSHEKVSSKNTTIKENTSKPDTRQKSPNKNRNETQKILTKPKNIHQTSSPSPEKRRVSRSLSTDKQSNRSDNNAPIKRYYGRRRDDDESSSSLSVDSEESDDYRKTSSNQNYVNDVLKVKPYSRSSEFKTGTTKSSIGVPINPREKLKKKMQLLLNKQYKADKKAETERIERQLQQQQERDEEMRELALKLRRKQRELRHKYGDPHDSKTDSDSDHKEVRGSSTFVARSKRRDRSSSTTSSLSSSSSDSRHKRRTKKRRRSGESSGRKYSRRSRSRSRDRR